MAGTRRNRFDGSLRAARNRPLRRNRFLGQNERFETRGGKAKDKEIAENREMGMIFEHLRNKIVILPKNNRIKYVKNQKNYFLYGE